MEQYSISHMSEVIARNEVTKQSLTLYHFMGCPYCQKVRDYLKKEGITVPMKDIHENPSYRDELVKIGGKAQVPCLVIDGKALYESLDIITWFKNNYKK